MANSPSQRPDDSSTAPGSQVAGTQAKSAISGTRDNVTDPTAEPGQYPPGNWATAFFGGPQPMGTGAPGSQGARPGSAADPTNEPGQVTEGLTGIGPPDTTDSGAPGSPTPRVTPSSGGGPDAVTYTDPGSYLSGSYDSYEVNTALDGPQDSTQANTEGYATGGPQLPGIKGNEPVPGGKYQPGAGRVLRGGRSVRP